MPYSDETELVKIYETADELFRPRNRSAPRFMENETPVSYRKRIATGLQEYAPSLKDINVRDTRGSAFDLIEKQIYNEARREAERPSNIPDGELREMRKFDVTGRPFYEFHGRASTWMNDFTHGTKKHLVGIKTEHNPRQIYP